MSVYYERGQNVISESEINDLRAKAAAYDALKAELDAAKIAEFTSRKRMEQAFAEKIAAFDDYATLKAENERLRAACQNVVMACPGSETTDQSFWPVREQCRLAVGDNPPNLLADDYKLAALLPVFEEMREAATKFKASACRPGDDGKYDDLYDDAKRELIAALARADAIAPKETP